MTKLKKIFRGKRKVRRATLPEQYSYLEYITDDIERQIYLYKRQF